MFSAVTRLLSKLTFKEGWEGGSERRTGMYTPVPEDSSTEPTHPTPLKVEFGRKSIAFIGAGNISSSLIGGLVSNGYDPKRIWAANPSQAKLKNLEQNLHIHTTQDNHQAVAAADIIVLAVKPQQMQELVQKLAQALEAKLVISLAAGVRIAQLHTWLGYKHTALVRCMPNTPALIGAGVTGLYTEPAAKVEKKLVEAIFQAVGMALWLEREEQIDIVAALAGCGPAYFFKVMEVLQSGAEKLGLPSEQANMLTLQTALGAIKMALATAEPLQGLREKVTSKGGMTARAIEVLEAGRIDQLFYEALRAAQIRANEIAKELNTT